MTEKEFTNGLSWIMMQLLGEGKTEDELQAILQEACRVMFAADEGDVEAGKLVLTAGSNYQATIQMAREIAKRKASALH